MRLVLTPEQMRLLEGRAFQLGVPSLLLMENAARESLAYLSGVMGSLDQRDILFLIGKGNNGGDGLALARLARLRGGKPRVLLLDEPATHDARANLAYVQALGIPVTHWDESRAGEGLLPVPEAVVDAVYGIGFHGALPPKAASLAATVNGWKVPVFSLDLPSGIDGKTCMSSGAVFKASHTLVYGHLKTGHCLPGSRGLMGELAVLDLGIPLAAYEVFEGMELPSMLEEPDLAALLPRRGPAAHKGSNGRVLMYMGSRGLAGAAAMAALACLRAGAGLVTLACEEEIIPTLQTLVPGATCMPIQEAIKNKPKYDVFAVGCGLGKAEGVYENILALWDRDKPSVWDADALNLLAKNPFHLGDKAVLTPHPGEASRLLGRGIAEITGNPQAAAADLQRIYGGTVVLKDAISIIEDGKRTAYNAVGSPALAKGGSGDALAGIAAGLLAQRPEGLPFDSARLACLWLGMAGREAARQQGVLSPLTLDVITCMGKAAMGF